MQTQKMLYALGLTSLGIVAPCGITMAATGETNNITEFQVATEPNATRITITGTQPFKPEISDLGTKSKGATVITVPGVWSAGKAGIRSVGKNGISFVRCGQFAMRPSKQVRVVANHQRGLGSALAFELTPSADQTRWEILLTTAGKVTTAVAPVELGARPERSSLSLRDPLPGTAQPSSKGLTTPLPRFSVDTKALVAAATRVASTQPLVATSATPMSGPRLSLATVVTIAPRPRTLTTPVVPQLKPYSARTLEPMEQRTIQVASLKDALLPPLPKTAQAVKEAQVVATAKPTTVTATPPEAAPAEAVKAKVQENLNPLDRMVSVDFVNAELPEALKLIAIQAKANVVAGQGVNGKKITLSLQKVLLRDALDWVTRTSGLAYTLEGGTIIVGTGQEIAQLKRTAQTPEASSATIPFYYADAESLKSALAASFPNVTLSVIKSSEESKKSEPDQQQNNVAGQVGERPAGSKPESLGAVKPRGGAIYVVGTNQIITEIRKTIEDTEKGLIEIAQRDSETKATRMRSYVNDIYEVKYVDPTQAANLVLESVPNVIIRPGPAQRFIANSVGLNSAFGGLGGAGMGGGMAGGMAGGMGGGMAGGMAGGIPPAGAANGAPVQQGQGQGQGQMGNNQIESRVLLLTGKPEDVARAKEMLAKLDVRVPQFIYEARLVEIQKDNRDQLGLNLDFGRAVNIGENDNGGPANTSVNGIPGGRQPNGGTIFRTPYSVSAKIDALATLGKANILARPTLSALDGNAATTFIGDQVPYIITQSISPTGGLNIQTGIANAGIRLQVSGRSNGDGTMTVYVHPEISTISQFVGTLPQISTRFVDTTIRVKDGETIAIGGLVRRQDIDNMRKVPGLGDLPVLGQLFRSMDKRRQETEVLIFITCSLAKD